MPSTCNVGYIIQFCRCFVSGLSNHVWRRRRSNSCCGYRLWDYIFWICVFTSKSIPKRPHTDICLHQLDSFLWRVDFAQDTDISASEAKQGFLQVWLRSRRHLRRTSSWWKTSWILFLQEIQDASPQKPGKMH